MRCSAAGASLRTRRWRTGSQLAVTEDRISALKLKCALESTGSASRGREERIQEAFAFSSRPVIAGRPIAGRLFGFGRSAADKLEVFHRLLADSALHVLLAHDVESAGKACRAKRMLAGNENGQARRVLARADGARHRCRFGLRRGRGGCEGESARLCAFNSMRFRV